MACPMQMMIMAICFEAAIQIALQYGKKKKNSTAQAPYFLLLRYFSILLIFTSFFVSQLISQKFHNTHTHVYYEF
jgi:cbb3-type cytochrome oxidase subunit 3